MVNPSELRRTLNQSDLRPGAGIPQLDQRSVFRVVVPCLGRRRRRELDDHKPVRRRAASLEFFEGSARYELAAVLLDQFTHLRAVFLCKYIVSNYHFADHICHHRFPPSVAAFGALVSYVSLPDARVTRNFMQARKTSP